MESADKYYEFLNQTLGGGEFSLLPSAKIVPGAHGIRGCVLPKAGLYGLESILVLCHESKHDCSVIHHYTD